MELIHVLLSEYCHNLTDAYQPLCTKQQITLCRTQPCRSLPDSTVDSCVGVDDDGDGDGGCAERPSGPKCHDGRGMEDGGWRRERGTERTNGERWRLTRCVSYIPIPGFHEIWTRLRGFPWEVAPNMSPDRTFRRGMRRWACPL